MTPHELQAALVASGVPCRLQRSEVAIQVCLFCSNAKWNLECNAEKGVFHAWCCKRGGRLDKLLKDVTGEDYRITVQRVEREKLAPQKQAEFLAMPIEQVESAMLYLGRRGITPQVAKAYGIAYVNQPGPPPHMLHGRIAIPAKDFWSGEVVGWIGRSYTGQKPKYITTLQQKIITGWRQRSSFTTSVVVEGPLDGITAHLAGFNAAVLSGIGGSGVEDWAARLSPESDVIVMLDGDAVEQARQLYWKIAAVRKSPLLVTLPPGSDPASIGVSGVQRVVAGAVSSRQVT